MIPNMDPRDASASKKSTLCWNLAFIPGTLGLELSKENPIKNKTEICTSRQSDWAANG